MDHLAQVFDGKNLFVSKEAELAEFVLPPRSYGKSDIHRSLVRRLFYNFGLGLCDLGIEVAVLKKDGEEILLGLKHEPATRVVLAGHSPGSGLKQRQLSRAGAAEVDVANDNRLAGDAELESFDRTVLRAGPQIVDATVQVAFDGE